MSVKVIKMRNDPTYLIIPDPERVEESLSLASEYGLGFEFDDFFHPDVLDDKDKCRSLIKMYRSYEMPETLTMHGDFYDVLIFSEDSKIREISEMRVRQSMDIAAELGVKGVVYHTNHMPNFRLGSYIQRWTEMNCRFWQRILEEYKGLEVYMENMFDTDPYVIAELGKAMRGTERFGICLDYAHSCAFGDENKIAEWCELLSPYIKHMHINDNDLENDLHLAVGDGKIDWDRFYGLLSDVMSPETILIETASIERQRRSVEYLIRKGYIAGQ